MTTATEGGSGGRAEFGRMTTVRQVARAILGVGRCELAPLRRSAFRHSWRPVVLGAVGAVAVPTIAMSEPADDRNPAMRLSGGVTVVSDYISRGVSLTDNRPALQASVLATHESGAYVSGWVSNTRFGAVRMEIDLGAGYLWEVRGTQFDIGYVRYIYPGGSDSGEVYASASRSFGSVTGKIGAYYSRDTPDTRSSAYPFVEAGTEILESPPLTLSGHLGYFHYDRGRAAPYQNYADWNVALSTSVIGCDVSLAYADTSVGAEPGERLAGAKIILSIGRAF